MTWWNEGFFATDCWGMVSLGLGFTTAKSVSIKDWRLGLMLRILQIIIVGYVIFDVVNQKAYLALQVPIPSFYVTSASGTFPAALSEADMSPPFYCTNSSLYEYDLDMVGDGLNASISSSDLSPVECAPWDEELLATTVGPGTTMISTYAQTTTTRYRTANSLAECPPAAQVFTAPEQAPYAQYALPTTFLGSTCTYKLTTQTLPMAPENLTVQLGFDFTLPASGGKISNTDVQCTIVSEYAEPVVLPTGEILISAPVSQWLQWTNVSLDQNIAQLSGEDAAKGVDVNGTIPLTRVTGVKMAITVGLYNEGLQPAGDTQCVISINPTLYWTAAPTLIFRLWDQAEGGLQVVQTYGVLFTFSGGGSWGQFNITNLINALVSGVVLLSVATTLTTYVAQYALGVRSKLYTSFIFEQVDYKREFARYAAQSLVAAQYFKAKDKNSSGTLDRAEIFNGLVDLFEGYLSKDEIMALADFVIMVGDSTKTTDDEDEEASVSGGTICLEEWMSTFTEDKCTIAMLKDIIEDEYTPAEKDHIQKLIKRQKRKTREDIDEEDIKLEKNANPDNFFGEGHDDDEEEGPNEDEPMA